MTLDRYGEPLPLEDEDNPVDITTRTRDEIHRDRCEQLRRILREARTQRRARP